MKKSMYHYRSIVTGQLATNFFDMVKLTIFELKHTHIFEIWKYSRVGF